MSEWRRLLAAPWIGPGVLAGSIALAVLFVVHVFGGGAVLSALAGANPTLLLAAFGCGIVNELLRAQRARLILQRDRPLRLAQSYAPMVLGHGLGDTVPLLPAGPALRALLTERIAGIPAGFAVGAYMLEGILDNIGPALLTVYLLWALPLPGWAHTALLVALLQGLLLAVLLVVALRGSRLRSVAGRHERLARLISPAGDVVRGLCALVEGERCAAARVVPVSLVMTAVSALQLVLFLGAFGLGTTAPWATLVLVLTLAAGSIPIKLPGFGTVAATMVLQVARIHGPDAGGYVVLSRVVASSLTPTLAILLLSWWAVTGRAHHLELWPALRRAPAPA